MDFQKSIPSMEDSKKVLGDTMSRHQANIFIWGGFFVVSLLVFYFISSGDFSFLLTYASFMRCFGFILLNYKIWTVHSVKGVSAKTVELYAVVFLTRLLSILRHSGYLPYDKSGDWFYHTVEIISFCCIAGVLYGIFGPLKPSYDDKFDKFGNFFVPNELGALYILGPATLLALFLHPSLNHEMLSDVCWTISMYVECAAMLPQLYMFQKQAVSDGSKTVEAILGHMAFALGFSRVFELIFWVTSFTELTHYSGGRIVGWVVLLAQLGHLIVMGDFFYYYLISMLTGKPMELPTTTSYVVDV
jgi:ER lumen protein retaining receptor